MLRCAVLCCAALCCAVLSPFCLPHLSIPFCPHKALLLTADQRRWLQDKGSENQKGQSKSGSYLQPLRVAKEQSVARRSRKDSNARMKVGEAAAATADYTEPDRYDILLA